MSSIISAAKTSVEKLGFQPLVEGVKPANINMRNVRDMAGPMIGMFLVLLLVLCVIFLGIGYLGMLLWNNGIVGTFSFAKPVNSVWPVIAVYILLSIVANIFRRSVWAVIGFFLLLTLIAAAVMRK